MTVLHSVLCAGWLVLAAALPVPAAEVPYLSGRVVDNAEILSAAVRERITATLKAHEGRTGNQVAVLTVPTIHGESVEEYALKVSHRFPARQAAGGARFVVRKGQERFEDQGQGHGRGFHPRRRRIGRLVVERELRRLFGRGRQLGRRRQLRQLVSPNPDLGA